MDGIRTGEYKDYYFPNQASSRTLWYHVGFRTNPWSIVTKG